MGDTGIIYLRIRRKSHPPAYPSNPDDVPALRRPVQAILPVAGVPKTPPAARDGGAECRTEMTRREVQEGPETGKTSGTGAGSWN